MTDRADRTDGWQLENSGPEAYERYLVPEMFTPWADALVERAELVGDEHVLDVGCGTGIVARRVAPRLDGGRVVGIDVNEGMLAVAASAGQEAGPAIEWQRGDATDLPFPDGSFDTVLCQQVLQFVGEPGAALAEAHRVLRAGGRLVTSVWRPVSFNPAYVVMADVLERHAGGAASAMMRSPFPPWTVSELRTLLQDAGFREVTVTIEVGGMRYPSVEAFLQREAASSPLADELGSLDPGVREALTTDLREGLAEYIDDQGVSFPMESYVAVARP